MSLDYYLDTMRQIPNTLAASISSKYSKRIQWILNDFKTDIRFPSESQEVFKAEIKNDVLITGSITELCLKLNTTQKAQVESILESLINGEKLTIILNENN
jgi:hypothetical protein